MFRALFDQIRLTWRLIRDPRVPLWSKLIPLAGIAYILSPLDIIPDVLIVIGQLDDLGILIGAMRLFESVVPEYIVIEHRTIIERSHRPLEVVDAPQTSYRVTRADHDGR
jgi:uncharacterized membrane protein YkvA (DUF1232 family)